MSAGILIGINNPNFEAPTFSSIKATVSIWGEVNFGGGFCIFCAELGEITGFLKEKFHGHSHSVIRPHRLIIQTLLSQLEEANLLMFISTPRESPISPFHSAFCMTLIKVLINPCWLILPASAGCLEDQSKTLLSTTILLLL
jgi:hypothetical protein